MREILATLITSYNTYLQAQFGTDPDVYFESSSKEKTEGDWMNAFCDILNAEPKRVLADVMPDLTEEELHEWYIYAAKQILDGVPLFLIDALKKSEGTDDFLCGLLQTDIMKKNFYDPNTGKQELEELELLLAVIHTMGNLPESDGMKNALLDGFEKSCAGNEMVLETIGNTFLMWQDSGALIEFLAKALQIDEKETHLLQALVSMSVALETARKDEIYNCLRVSFKRSKDHVQFTLAMMLGDFGDNRAIPMLRTYAKRHIEQYASMAEDEKERKNEKEKDIFVLFNIIEYLGGNTEDLHA